MTGLYMVPGAASLIPTSEEIDASVLASDGVTARLLDTSTRRRLERKDQGSNVLASRNPYFLSREL
jgi:hypothetical protein